MTVLPDPRHDPASTPNSASSEDAEKGACSVPAGAWNGAAEAPGKIRDRTGPWSASRFWASARREWSLGLEPSARVRHGVAHTSRHRRPRTPSDGRCVAGRGRGTQRGAPRSGEAVLAAAFSGSKRHQPQLHVYNEKYLLDFRPTKVPVRNLRPNS